NERIDKHNTSVKLKTEEIPMPQLFPFTDPADVKAGYPRAIVRCEGATVIDVDGNRFYDAVSGLWCASLGFSHPRLIEAARTQMETLSYYHSFMGRTPQVANALAEALAEVTPRGIGHFIYGQSGSDAVDTAIKLVRYYQNARGKPSKKKILARDGAYHGAGGMSAALTAFSYCHDGFDTQLDTVIRLTLPHYAKEGHPGESEMAFKDRLCRELEEKITAHGADTIGAMIGEPVLGAGGVIPPPEGYWEAVQRILKKNDILAISDETITGFGRTGCWFGCERYGLEPDIMTMAKQLTAAHFPLSAVGLSDPVHREIAAFAHAHGTLGHGFTYGGHPVGAAVALETLAIYRDIDLATHVAELSQNLAAGLTDLAPSPFVFEIRQAGFMAGVELTSDTGEKDGLARKVASEAEKRGVFFRVIGNTLAISPPYIATPDEIEWLVQTLQESLNAATAELEPIPS
ncbi:MAG: aminotransferase class III-fold pyridoxal phosphate-dependent enzyme, partial [Pseudomonadota bacterium]